LPPHETSDAFDRFKTLHFSAQMASSMTLPPAVGCRPIAPAPCPQAARLSLRPRARAIGGAMLQLARRRLPDTSDSPTMGRWLRDLQQPENAIRRFWAVVLESAWRHARACFGRGGAESFVDVSWPRARLTRSCSPPATGEIWHRAGVWLAHRGAKLHQRARIERLEFSGSVCLASC